MRHAAALLAASIATIAITLAARADAYCRSSACDRGGGSTDGHVCVPEQPDDCGIALQWKQPCVGFNVLQGDSKQVSYADAEVTLALAFQAWLDVGCEPGKPSIEVYPLGPVECGTVEYNQHAGNANVLVFQDKHWPHETDTGLGTADTLALTTVTYDVEKGEIYDADIEVNTAENVFSLSDEPGPDDVDLLSVLTHEAGHFLGLAHSAELDTTMFPDYTRGTTTIRQLAPDDIAAICATYPANRKKAGECTAIPRHGFAPECVEDQTYVKCSVSSGEGGDSGDRGSREGLALGAIAIAIGLRRITTRRGSRRS
jgi:hypothetical protein